MNEYTQGTGVAIVGGGLSGLAAACYLAKQGQPVTLFEKAASLGGMARTQEMSGYLFNMGAHALYEKSAAVEVLRELGVRFTSGSPTGIKAAAGNRLFGAPIGPLSLMQTGLLSRSAKWEATRILFRISTLKPETVAGITLQDWLDGNVRHPQVRQLIEAVTRTATYSDAPELLSMQVAAEQLQHATGKIHYIDGGWQTLVDELTRIARESGVTIKTGTEVVSVEGGATGVHGVRLRTGEVHRAGSVVLATSPNLASRLVDGGHNAVLSKWADAAVPVQVASFDVGLRNFPRPRNAVVLGIDRPLFLTSQSRFCKIAPDGGALICTLKYLRPGAILTAEKDHRDLEGLLDLAQPGWRDVLAEHRYLPHITVSNALVTAAQGGTAARPGPQVPGVAGLYVAGDWIGPSGILAAAGLWSAKLAAASIASRGSRAELSVAA